LLLFPTKFTPRDFLANLKSKSIPRREEENQASQGAKVRMVIPKVRVVITAGGLD
jgi:hypothetical protein